MREISFQKALEEAVAEEMRRDPRVITMATDFTGDPLEEFGPARVRFSPISEAVLNGIAYDERSGRLFVTGKLWPRLFELRLKRIN